MNDDRHVVVIGSGHSGAIAALWLLERGVPVSMLESGQTHPGGLMIRAMGRNIYRRKPDLPTAGLPAGAAVRFTFGWEEGGRPRQEFEVRVTGERPRGGKVKARRASKRKR